MQQKRQERIDHQQNLQSLQDEFDVLKLESAAATSSLEKSKAKVDIAVQEVSDKTKQLETFQKRFDSIKADLDAEKNLTLSKEKRSEYIEAQRHVKEKELKQLEGAVHTLRERMIKDSDNLARLRENESDLIAEIKSTQVSIFSVINIT